MGKKLSRDEYIESMGALQKFYFACDHNHGPMDLNVEVIDESTERVDFELQVTTTITYDNSRQTISLIWEYSELDNFKSLGLFGVYWALYNEMEYNEDEKSLLVRSTDSDKIVKVYAK